jgi:hypothetical protein
MIGDEEERRQKEEVTEGLSFVNSQGNFKNKPCNFPFSTFNVQ